MSRRPRLRASLAVAPAWVLLLGLAAVLLPGLPASQAQPSARSEGALGAAEEPTDEGRDAIDEHLGGEEEILAGEGYTYDPADRRDPFKSLLAATELPDLRGPRPDGIPGLLIDEVTVTGIFRTRDGYVAQVQSAANEKSYLLKQGDELYDGDIVRVTSNEIVFKQIVQDPTALKPFREVVKSLSAGRS